MVRPRPVPLLFVGRDAYAVVLDRKKQVLLRLFERDLDLHLALAGEFYRISHQIEQDLPQTGGIAFEIERDVAVNMGVERCLLFIGPQRDDGGDRFEQGGEVEINGFKFGLAGLYL